MIAYLQCLVVKCALSVNSVYFPASCKSAICKNPLKIPRKNFDVCLVVKLKVSTFASAIERDTPWDCRRKEFFERFSIQTSSTRSCTVMSSLYRVNELTVNLRF